MQRISLPFKSAVLGLGLMAATQLSAQITSPSTSEQSTTINARSPRSALQDGKALIGAALSTTSGQYGTIADLVFDGNGAIQYALVERQGALHPLPYSMLQVGANGDVTASVSSSTLDTVSVDRARLQSFSDPTFAAQLRAAFGSNAARSFSNPSANSSGFSTPGSQAGATAGSSGGVNSSTRQSGQVFSLAGLLGGMINAQGGEAGAVSTVAIAPNGQIVYAVGANASGDSRFAIPFSLSALNSAANGINVNATSQALSSVNVPTGSLPTLSDSTFASSFQSAFGDQAFGVAGRLEGLSKQESDAVRRNDSSSTTPTRPGDRAFGVAGRIEGMSKQESDSARRNDRSNSDPVAGAGDPSRGGADAVARAGDRTRSGADAVANPGDQRTTSGTTSTTTGGIINIAQDAPPTQSKMGGASGLLQMKDLLNFKVQAQDGAFGRVSDVVFDRNGNVQYLLGSYQGQTYPLPFSQSAFSGAPNTMTLDVPMATLQQMSIDPNRLPNITDQAFTERMRQVFGQSFAANSNSTGSDSRTTGATGGNVANSRSTGTTGTTSGTTSGTSGTATGTAGTTTQGAWGWPSGTDSRYPVPDPRTGRQDFRPNPITKTPAMKGTGVGTDTGSGANRFPAPDPRTGRQDIRPNPITKSRSGNTDNSGIGTGGRGQNPPPRGTGKGLNNTQGTGTGAGTSGSGAGSSGGGSGS